MHGGEVWTQQPERACKGECLVRLHQLPVAGCGVPIGVHRQRPVKLNADPVTKQQGLSACSHCTPAGMLARHLYDMQLVLQVQPGCTGRLGAIA